MTTRLWCFRMLKWGGWRQVDDKWMVELNDWEGRIYEKFGERFGGRPSRPSLTPETKEKRGKNFKNFIYFNFFIN